MPADTVVSCALPGCNNTFTHNPSDRRKREFCSNRCKQKAYRLRKQPALERNVTISSYEQMLGLLDTLTTDQLEALQERTQVRLHQRAKQPAEEPTSPFLYFRKGSGVVHLAVSRNVSICGRETQSMSEVQPNDQDHICSYCTRTRDSGTWWENWRELLMAMRVRKDKPA